MWPNGCSCYLYGWNTPWIYNGWLGIRTLILHLEKVKGTKWILKYQTPSPFPMWSSHGAKSQLPWRQATPCLGMPLHLLFPLASFADLALLQHLLTLLYYCQYSVCSSVYCCLINCGQVKHFVWFLVNTIRFYSLYFVLIILLSSRYSVSKTT